jgi:acetate CoA/acetoacetate CoA-transferase alpha subunit
MKPHWLWLMSSQAVGPALRLHPMKHAIAVEAAAAKIGSGARLMVGGFMGVGSPHRLIDAIVAHGPRNLTLIANDTARPGEGVGKLISAGLVSHVITSHIGLNPETQAKMLAGELQVELVPQGSLVERIRAGGHGLGGVLVKTGLGTLAAEGKTVVDIDGEPWLLERPLRADFALLHAHMADYLGNLSYQLTATNFNPVMAMAADHVICEANEIVPIGMITPNDVTTPGVLVDDLIQNLPHRH